MTSQSLELIEQPESVNSKFIKSKDSRSGLENFIISSWSLIRRRQRWFYLGFGLGVTFVGLNTLRERIFYPVYQGSFQIVLRDPIDLSTGGGNSPLSSGQSTNPAIDSRITFGNLPDLITVLQSPAILHPIAKEAGLPSNALDGKVDIFQPNLKADGILQINLRWDNPITGQKIINDLAAGYFTYSVSQRRNKLLRGLLFIDQQTPALQSRVNKLQEQLATLRTTQGFLEPEARSKEIAANMAEVEVNLNNLGADYLKLQSLRASVVRGNLISPSLSSSPASSSSSGELSSGSTPLVATSAFSQLLESLISVEKEIAETSASFKPNSPVLQSLLAKRNKLKPLLQRRELDSIDASLRENVSAQQALRSQYARLSSAFKLEGPDQVKKFQSLQQRLELAKENLSNYLKQREDIRLEVAQQAEPWKLIQEPYFLADPVSPDLAKNFRNGLFLALFAGVSAAALRDRFDRVFHNLAELDAMFNLPILGIIPHINSDPTSAIFESENDQYQSAEEWRLKEAVRNIYTSLKIVRESKKVNLLSITSVSSNDGKTTSIALLGKSFSDLGLKVLLIDADMRKTELHHVLKLNNERGFSDLFVNEQVDLDSILQWITPNLAVLPAGQKVADPVRLLNSNRFLEIIQNLRNLTTFDLIMIDTPPALSLVDPILISKELDGLLLLVGLGRTEKNMLVNTIKRIESSKIDLLGFVCVDSPSSNQQPNYRYYDYEPKPTNISSPIFTPVRSVDASVEKVKELVSWLDQRR